MTNQDYYQWLINFLIQKEANFLLQQTWPIGEMEKIKFSVKSPMRKVICKFVKLRKLEVKKGMLKNKNKNSIEDFEQILPK